MQVPECGNQWAKGSLPGKGEGNCLLDRLGSVRGPLPASKASSSGRWETTQEGWGGTRCGVGGLTPGPPPPAVISLPLTYRKLVLGLCGNCDQNKRNDFMLPNGAVTQNLLAFGNSWEVKMTEGSLPRVSR